MELCGKVINFLGDSITQGHGTSGTDKMFTSLIAEKTGAICNNYGLSGTRIAAQKNPTVQYPHQDLDFNLRAPQMADNADIVFVFGGTNDFGHGDAPIGSMEDRTPETFYGALHSLYVTLITKYPAAQIVVATPLHRLDDEKPDLNNPGKVERLKDYVEIIREVAEYYSLPVLDLYKTSGLQPKVDIIKEKYIPDGLHPNDAGHIILTEKIIAFLKSI